MRRPRAGHALVAAAGEVFAVGGDEGRGGAGVQDSGLAARRGESGVQESRSREQGLVHTAELYDPAADQWVLLGPLRAVES